MKKINFLSVFGFLSILFGIGFLFGCSPKNNVKADTIIGKGDNLPYIYIVDFNTIVWEDIEESSDAFLRFLNFNNSNYYLNILGLQNTYRTKSQIENDTYNLEYFYLWRLYGVGNYNDKYSSVYIGENNGEVGIKVGSNSWYMGHSSLTVITNMSLDYMVTNNILLYDTIFDYSLNDMLIQVDAIKYFSHLTYYGFTNNINNLSIGAQEFYFNKGFEKGQQEQTNNFSFLSVVSEFLNYEFLPNFKFMYVLALGFGLSLLVIIIRSVLR